MNKDYWENLFDVNKVCVKESDSKELQQEGNRSNDIEHYERVADPVKLERNGTAIVGFDPIQEWYKYTFTFNTDTENESVVIFVPPMIEMSFYQSDLSTYQVVNTLLEYFNQMPMAQREIRLLQKIQGMLK